MCRPFTKISEIEGRIARRTAGGIFATRVWIAKPLSRPAGEYSML